MPQPSLYYACGRIGILRHNLLTRQQMERLISARDYDEACRLLSDSGYMDSADADFQTAADAHVEKACKMIERVTCDESLTDCFLLRYDIHNLKVLLKSRYLQVKPEYLSACGTLQLEKLRHAVIEHQYKGLPPILSQTMDELEAALAKSFDPLLIDARLDQALCEMIREKLKKVKLPAVHSYFAAMTDLKNLMMALRLQGMRKSESMLQKLILPGGKLSMEKLVSCIKDASKMKEAFAPYGKKVLSAALECMEDLSALSQLEKAADDHLLSILGSTRYQAAAPEILLSYLLTTQREAANVRLVMTGKLNGFAVKQIEERLREWHD